MGSQTTLDPIGFHCVHKNAKDSETFFKNVPQRKKKKKSNSHGTT